ncbi:MAG: hypothetical protein ACYDAZ_05990 [Thermoplasmataceae archaeon]
MKFRRFVVIFSAVVCAVLVILTTFPLVLVLDYRSSGLPQPTENGAQYTYYFSSPAITIKTGGYTDTNGTASGILYVQFLPNKIEVQIEVSFDFAGILSYHTYKQFQPSYPGQFLNTILLGQTLTKGNFVNVGSNLTGIIQGSSRYLFSTNYKGTNSSLEQDSRIDGLTTPTVLQIINFNSSGTEKLYPSWNGTVQYPQEYKYDIASNSDVLVQMYVSGTSSFLSTLFSSSNTSFVKAAGFYMTLLGTNVILNPLPYLHYLLQNIVIVVLIGLFSFLYLLVLRQRVINRGKNRKWG